MFFRGQYVTFLREYLDECSLITSRFQHFDCFVNVCCKLVEISRGEKFSKVCVPARQNSFKYLGDQNDIAQWVAEKNNERDHR